LKTQLALLEKKIEIAWRRDLYFGLGIRRFLRPPPEIVGALKKFQLANAFWIDERIALSKEITWDAVLPPAISTRTSHQLLKRVLIFFERDFRPLLLAKKTAKHLHSPHASECPEKFDNTFRTLGKVRGFRRIFHQFTQYSTINSPRLSALFIARIKGLKIEDVTSGGAPPVHAKPMYPAFGEPICSFNENVQMWMPSESLGLVRIVDSLHGVNTSANELFPFTAFPQFRELRYKIREIFLGKRGPAPHSDGEEPIAFFSIDPFQDPADQGFAAPGSTLLAKN